LDIFGNDSSDEEDTGFRTIKKLSDPIQKPKTMAILLPKKTTLASKKFVLPITKTKDVKIQAKAIETLSLTLETEFLMRTQVPRITKTAEVNGKFF
jgi:hypothetical protein